MDGGLSFSLLFSFCKFDDFQSKLSRRDICNDNNNDSFPVNCGQRTHNTFDMCSAIGVDRLGLSDNNYANKDGVDRIDGTGTATGTQNRTQNEI